MVGDGLTGDHVPSIAAIRANVENTLGIPLTRAQAAVLRNETNTIIVDAEFHASGRTYFGKNTPSQVAEDSLDLQSAAHKDQSEYLSKAHDFGYVHSDLRNAFDIINHRNSNLFEQLSTQNGAKKFFTDLGVWEPK